VAEPGAEGLDLGEATALANRSADEFAQHAHRDRPRVRESWDGRAERRFRRRVRSMVDALAEPETVTVVLPVRNGSETLSAAVQSVIAQTFTRWRLVIVDDGSTDETGAVALSFAADDSRINVIHLPPSGVSAARNAGIAESNTPYLAFLDADNRWAPDFLRCVLGGMIRAGTELAYSAVALREDDRRRYLGGEATYEDLRDGANVIDLNAFVVNRALVLEAGGFDERLPRWVDYDLVLRLMRTHTATYCPFLGVEYDHRTSRRGRITTSESRNWRAVVLGPHLIANAPLSRSVAGRVSVLVVAQGNLEFTLATIRNLLDTADGRDVEVIVLDNGGPRSFSRVLRIAFARRNVKVIRMPRDRGHGLAANIGLAACTGEFVLFLNHVAKLARGWPDRLVPYLSDDSVVAVQPLLRGGDGTTASAGTIFYGGTRLPGPFLAGLPLEDAKRAGRDHRWAGSSMCLLVRAGDVRAVGGFDLRFPSSLSDADLCLRLSGVRRGDVRIALDEVVTVQDSSHSTRPPPISDRRLFDEVWSGRQPADQSDDYRRIGLRAVGSQETADALPFGAPMLERVSRDGTRWAIKIAAPAAARGDHWGDRFFAEDLAGALESRGLVVSVDRREAAHRGSAALDDVAVFIRGRTSVRPVPGIVNVLWVISHPDDVDVDEVRAFDVVFAASRPWAEEMTARSGRDIGVLLQATDVGTFSDRSEDRRGCVFVGSAREGVRPIVRLAQEADADLRIYGRGWNGLVPREILTDGSIERAEVADVYARAAAVLNDQWEDMAAHGFVANRVFDALASGAMVITTPVAGIADISPSGVRVVRTEAELREVLRERVSAESRRDWATAAAEVHGFPARAAALADSVDSIRKCVSVERLRDHDPATPPERGDSAHSHRLS
jgi:glycosyltransferase involved in cell wall biosynthesis